MQAVPFFLSCDWGTSSFRLRLVDTAGFRVLAEQKSKEGNSSTFQAWKESGRPVEERLEFYLSVVGINLKELGRIAGRSLNGLPLVISGMASSTIGMVELPYKELPFLTDGSDLKSEIVSSPGFDHEILIISGVKTGNDVIRGEETQLVGSLTGQEPHSVRFLHPGTHSKHMDISGGQAVSFKTYMTGELFSLLAVKSILSASVKNVDFHRPEHLESFRRGVLAGKEEDLLHQLFLVRTNDLIGRLSPEQNYYYLSGLLIASELKDFPANFKGEIIMAGEDVLTALYLEALKILEIDRQVSGLKVKNADEVTIKGQYQIYTHRR